MQSRTPVRCHGEGCFLVPVESKGRPLHSCNGAWQWSGSAEAPVWDSSLTSSTLDGKCVLLIRFFQLTRRGFVHCCLPQVKRKQHGIGSHVEMDVNAKWWEQGLKRHGTAALGHQPDSFFVFPPSFPPHSYLLTFPSAPSPRSPEPPLHRPLIF